MEHIHVICAGRCNAASRRAQEAYEIAYTAWQDRQPTDPDDDPQPAAPDLEWVEGDPHWCARDRASIRRALAEVDRLAAVLDQWADGHRGATSGEKISHRATGPGSPSPIADLLDTLYGEVTDLEDEWRDFRGYVPVQRGSGRGAHHRMTAIGFISMHLDDILSYDEHAAFGHRVWSWERLLQARTRTDPVVRNRPGRCPRCSMVSVLQTRDDGYTECRGCGRLLSEDEYQRDVVDGADSTVVEDARSARHGKVGA